MYRAGHTLILAHAAAYRIYDEKFRESQGGLIGITLSCGHSEGTEPHLPENWDAAWHKLEFELGWFADPIFASGDYPNYMKEKLGNSSDPENFLPKFSETEISNNIGSDFFGLNHYSTYLFRPCKDCLEGFEDTFCENWPGSGSEWLRSVPWGFRKLLRHIKRKYKHPIIYVTENGISEKDSDVTLNDFFRVGFSRPSLRKNLTNEFRTFIYRPF